MKRTQLAFTLGLFVCSDICSSCYSGDGYTMHFKGSTTGRQPVEIGLNTYAPRPPDMQQRAAMGATAWVKRGRVFALAGESPETRHGNEL